jgi:hypothetical protein
VPSADRPEEPEDHEVVVYELDEWTAEERAELQLRLDAEHITHQWDTETELLVSEADEARVDAILDELVASDELAAEDDLGEDDEERYATMSDLFVAADRIAGTSSVDVDLGAAFVEAAAAVEGQPAPYGIDEFAWERIGELALTVTAALENEAGDDVVIRHASTLRDLLRRYV